MALRYADQTADSAAHAYDECVRAGFALDWFGKANLFRNPLGHLSGEGAVLLTRDQLDAIDDLNSPHDLVFSDGTNDPVTLKNLHVAGGTTCVTPGGPTGPAIHFVPLADCRRVLRLAVVNTGYNLRQTPGGNYQDHTTQDGAGTAWTWAQVFADLWGMLDADVAGEAPDLPGDPQGTPEQLAYHGWAVMDAIGDLLARLGYSLSLDLTEDEDGVAIFSVVSLGDEQAGLDAAWDKGTRLRDIEPVSTTYGTVPASLKVLFRKEPTRAYGNTPFYEIDVDPPDGAEDGEAGVLMLFDDLRATYQGGTVTNDADLQDRADARAEEFFRERRDWFATSQRRVWSGARKDVPTGERIQSVTWRDAGYGVLTEAARVPPRDPTADWPGTPEQPWRLTEVVYLKPATTGPQEEYMDAQVERWNADLDAWEILFDCWLKNITETDLPVGRYHAKFEGFQNDRPVYVAGCCPDGTAEGDADATDSTVPGDNDWDDDVVPKDTPPPSTTPNPSLTGPPCAGCPSRPLSRFYFVTVPGVGTCALTYNTHYGRWLGCLPIPGSFTTNHCAPVGVPGGCDAVYQNTICLETSGSGAPDPVCALFYRLGFFPVSNNCPQPRNIVGCTDIIPSCLGACALDPDAGGAYAGGATHAPVAGLTTVKCKPYRATGGVIDLSLSGLGVYAGVLLSE